jgi:hypothetical protein
MVAEVQLFESPGLTPLDFCCGVWIKKEFHRRKVNTRYELLARILGAAARIEKREDQLRRKTRDLRTIVAKCSEVDGGGF